VTVARWILAVGGVVSLLNACATDPGVATESAERLVTPTPTTEDPAPPTTGTPPATDVPTPPTPPSTTDPSTTDVPTTDGPTTTVPDGSLGDRLDVGDAKPARDYDEFVRLALNDIEEWWSVEYPETYGEPFEPLAGGVFAAYPERTAPIPGCETDAPTTYEEIAEYSAFYCAQGDFMVYDDGAEGVLAELAREFGQSILGVVFAHEYGHAIQSRAGVLDRNLPTVVSEQQADCFAGAWVAHVRAGDGDGITFTDDDVRSGLVAMITVSDPIGIDTLDPGGHGSAFDRVGAFQTGFISGTSRCAELADDPLPLVPNTFQPGSNPNGNSTYEQAVSFIPADAQLYWNGVLAADGLTMPTLTVVPVQSADEVTCEAPAGSFTTGAVYCSETQQVFYDDVLARDLYGRFGDFVVGYMVGGAFSAAAQTALGSSLEGEARFLADDCLTGAWSSSLLPEKAIEGDERTAVIEPGDLDEAIQAALVIGDDSASDDVLGSGFEKIASFREGVLDGLDACLVQIGG
jgi:predicted metalloprotease